MGRERKCTIWSTKNGDTADVKLQFHERLHIEVFMQRFLNRCAERKSCKYEVHGSTGIISCI
jgi:hypothetical protein